MCFHVYVCACLCVCISCVESALFRKEQPTDQETGAVVLTDDGYDGQEIAVIVSDLMHRSDLIALSEICERLHIDRMGCLRVEAYIGSTLLNLNSALYVKHKVHDHDCDVQRGCVTTKTGLLQAKGRSIEKRIMSEFANLFEYIPNATEREHKFIVLDNAGPMQFQRFAYPTITSTAPVPDPDGNSVIVRMYRDRYEGAVVNVRSNDLPFSAKKDVLVWRGSARCHRNAAHFKNRSRNLFVQKYGNVADKRFDVGYAGADVRGVPHSQLRDHLSLTQQLQYKFIMVIDGVDVASDMEWAMASNSVPFMLSCKVQRWGLHSWLQPWKHYVPIDDDFSDLPTKLDWAISNPALAEEIANNGKDFIHEFDDKNRENRINAAVLVAYFNRVRIEESADDTQLVGDVPQNMTFNC